jgi:hypothetical protein
MALGCKLIIARGAFLEGLHLSIRFALEQGRSPLRKAAPASNAPHSVWREFDLEVEDHIGIDEYLVGAVTALVDVLH